MARRKDHTPEELKELVLNTVIDSLQTAPASQLSLRKVAKMVGYSPGTLINLFGSYDYLLLAVNGQTLDLIFKQLKNAMEKEVNTEEQLTQFALTYLQFAKLHPFQWLILFEHHLPHDAEIPEWQLERINRLFNLIETALKEIAPNASENDIQQTSRTIWAAVHGICLLEVDDKLFADKSLNAKEMIRQLLVNYFNSWKNNHNS